MSVQVGSAASSLPATSSPDTQTQITAGSSSPTSPYRPGVGRRVEFLVANPGVRYGLSPVTDLLAVATVVTLGYFATVYTNRSTSPRRPQNALLLGWTAVAVGGILTQPVFGLQYASVTYRQEPTARLAMTPGPLYLQIGRAHV